MNKEIKESIEELWVLITALDGIERGEEHNAYTIKCIKNVINYITNLQQENETLKAKLEIGKTCGFCPYYDYKSRCKKANKLLKTIYKVLPGTYNQLLIEIDNYLQGSAENETNS